ncbi:c-type cytochrome [Ruegeria arenilitoris]|uniref:c-type cytochrome n=1 Tax=Ruegeria arenilitoris TaxID=1173585 RepID=UPI0020C3B42E|nr:cytochrome c [Ruegeria arenilitoris]
MKRTCQIFSQMADVLRLFGNAVVLYVCLIASQSFAETDSTQGKTLYIDFCARCHGLDAGGNGPDAADLETQPLDLKKIADRRNGVWPMLEVMSILDGYLKTTNPRDDMPVITELNEGPTIEFDTGNGLVTSVPAKLVALTEYLEAIQSPKPESYVP